MSYDQLDRIENMLTNIRPASIYIVEKFEGEYYETVGAYIDLKQLIEDFNFVFKCNYKQITELGHKECFISWEDDNYKVTKYNTNSKFLSY